MNQSESQEIRAEALPNSQANNQANNQLDHQLDHQLRLEIADLCQEVKRLQQANSDLKIVLETTIAHGDAVQKQLQAEVSERQKTEATLKSCLEIITRRKSDLEIILETTAEHGDTVEIELQEANQKLQHQIDERQKTEAKLQSVLEILSRDKADLEIMLQLTAAHGDVLQNQLERDVEEAKVIADIDGLTQIANRRKLNEYVMDEWGKMAREKLPISFMLCDVDYFKLYNDTYGHQAGDRCLIQVAEAISRVVKRPADLVARYGGEEFGVILPNTNSQGAIQVAEMVLAELQEIRIPHLSSTVQSYVTLSIGISSTVPVSGASPEGLIAVADRALYEAKKQGRNCLVFKSCNALTAFKINI